MNLLYVFFNLQFLTGSEWYSLEASRAINQAIGRVIRHKNDYGAIILMDSRFNSPKIKSQMSLWLRNQIKIVNNFGEVIRDLKNFFSNAQTKVCTSCYSIIKENKKMYK